MKKTFCPPPHASVTETLAVKETQPVHHLDISIYNNRSGGQIDDTPSRVVQAATKNPLHNEREGSFNSVTIPKRFQGLEA
ncbi:hypothetical protein F7734_11410 [Scytonema sp. UIC 10036]|uniref:hypothetical protein n=1 Tax=Scytonema sp. UIC 10036 TaxID=2304196 RepID=UPI0012DA5634|nr:hypothetical protein [Scytonema sp. UIC 10036]MUG93011.1 hypothetical protein [Scytonema sp. UIC 10036]